MDPEAATLTVERDLISPAVTFHFSSSKNGQEEHLDLEITLLFQQPVEMSGDGFDRKRRTDNGHLIICRHR